jgi:hypothetical protein
VEFFFGPDGGRVLLLLYISVCLLLLLFLLYNSTCLLLYHSVCSTRIWGRGRGERDCGCGERDCARVREGGFGP